jgi:hypothetical protein
LKISIAARIHIKNVRYFKKRKILMQSARNILRDEENLTRRIVGQAG